jgi:hypothetical protein
MSNEKEYKKITPFTIDPQNLSLNLSLNLYIYIGGGMGV